MNIVFFGTGGFGVPSLDALKKSKHSLLSIVTSQDKPQGRDLKVRHSPVKAWAVKNNYPVLQPDSVNSAEFVKKLADLKADLFVVISFGSILSKSVIETPAMMTLNVHSSLLPRYRGAAPIHRAMLAGETRTGVSVMRMIERLDAGDVMLQKSTPIEDGDDIISLESRLSYLGAEVLLEVISQMEKNTVVFTPQNEALSSYAKKIKKEDGRIEWAKAAREVWLGVRALKGWPGAYSFFQGKRILFLKAALSGIARPAEIAPGTIIVSADRKNIFVAASDELLEIKLLQWEGRNALLPADFLRGFSFAAGDKFE